MVIHHLFHVFCLINFLFYFHTPKIRFQYDKSIEYGNKIENLLNKIHEKDGE